jgi:hypothetical protein
MLPDVQPLHEELPIGAELPVMGAGVVSGIGVVTAGVQQWRARHVVLLCASGQGDHARQQGW